MFALRFDALVQVLKNLNPLIFVNENIFNMRLLKDEMASNESNLKWIEPRTQGRQ